MNERIFFFFLPKERFLRKISEIKYKFFLKYNSNLLLFYRFFGIENENVPRIYKKKNRFFFLFENGARFSHRVLK